MPVNENGTGPMQTRKVRYNDGEGAFEVTLPASWSAEKDGEGGLLLFGDQENALLHLMPFSRDPEEETDAADELYAFLAEHEIELEEDEVALLALCEYETDEDEEEVYWMVGVAAAAGQILFASYSCPASEAANESEIVREILASLTLG
jgi:hypothetical protein